MRRQYNLVLHAVPWLAVPGMGKCLDSTLEIGFHFLPEANEYSAPASR